MDLRSRWGDVAVGVGLGAALLGALYGTAPLWPVAGAIWALTVIAYVLARL